MDNKHYQTNAVDSAPELSTLSSEGYPTNGSPSLGIPATQPGAAWFHAVASEIANAIKAGGVTPDAHKVDQLSQSISAQISSALSSSGLDDLKAKVATNTSNIATNKNNIDAFSNGIQILKNLGDNYTMTYTDFDKSGFYQVSSFASGTNSCPSDNTGDFWIICQRHSDLNFTMLWLRSPRTAKVFTGNFWGGVWQGWNELSLSANITPPGSVILFGGNSIPAGFLLCNGAWVSKAQFPALWSAVGANYGASTDTFRLPDFRDRFPQGAGNAVPGTYLNPGLPGIWGNTGWIKPGFAFGGADGAFYDAGDSNGDSGGFTPRHDTTNRYRSGFNANRCSGLYGASSTVQPPALAINYIIKY